LGIIAGEKKVFIDPGFEIDIAENKEKKKSAQTAPPDEWQNIRKSGSFHVCRKHFINEDDRLVAASTDTVLKNGLGPRPADLSPIKLATVMRAPNN
jgi:hypothetical protein